MSGSISILIDRNSDLGLEALKHLVALTDDWMEWHERGNDAEWRALFDDALQVLEQTCANVDELLEARSSQSGEVQPEAKEALGRLNEKVMGLQSIADNVSESLR